jgi:tetratricopeptide (TPR) repeat protein
MIRTRTLLSCSFILAVLVGVILLGPVIRTTSGQAPGPSSFQPPGPYQTTNPNYLNRNPLYFEGKVDWNLLKIDQPQNAWDYLQRGMHRQDEMEDYAGAMSDYQSALALNSLQNGTCQIVSTPLPANLQEDPPPCMIIPRQRLAVLMMHDNPQKAISLFQEILQIDTKRLGINELIGETYVGMAEGAASASEATDDYQKALAAFRAELDLSPVTALTIQLTADEANNAHTHWAMAEVYDKLGDQSNEIASLQNYLKATKWHSDVYPWRIPLAQKKIAQLQAPAKREPSAEIPLPARRR